MKRSITFCFLVVSFLISSARADSKFTETYAVFAGLNFVKAGYHYSICDTFLPMSPGDTEIFACDGKTAVYVHIRKSRGKPFVDKRLFFKSDMNFKPVRIQIPQNKNKKIHAVLIGTDKKKICDCQLTLNGGEQREAICTNDDSYVCSVRLPDFDRQDMYTVKLFQAIYTESKPFDKQEEYVVVK